MTQQRLTDIELLVLADLNVAGEGGRVKTRILTLVADSGADLAEVLDNLTKREYMTVVKTAGRRAIGNKHYITDAGRRLFVHATSSL